MTSRASYLSALTMANPASLAWFLEMFGYAALGVATWLVADGFASGARAGIVRVLLKANGALSVLGAILTASIDEWVFSPTGIAAFLVWNALVIVCFGVIALSDDALYAGG
jgi:hypothetical protein